MRFFLEPLLAVLAGAGAVNLFKGVGKVFRGGKSQVFGNFPNGTVAVAQQLQGCGKPGLLLFCWKVLP